MSESSPAGPATHFDLIVIGSGPGGYVGAIRAAQLGMNVACIERDKLGGVCLNYGCIPTKALLKAAELYSEVAKHGADWGFEPVGGMKVDWEQLIGRSRRVTETLTSGVAYLFKKNKITHFAGHACITRGAMPTMPATLEIASSSGGTVQHHLTADRILIATGAVPRELPFAPFDEKTIISAKEAMMLSKQPEKFVIIGAGAIGCEFAYFYNAFGTEVTLIEMLDQILPIEDVESAKVVQREFKKSKINIKVKHTVLAIAINENGAGATVTIAKVDDADQTETIETDVVLVAVGVRGRFDGLFADDLNLETFKEHIKVDYRGVSEPTYETSVRGVYAIGDVIGPPWLAHVASEEAVTCVERMAGHTTLGVDYDLIPGCTYCHPQVASIGKTERALVEAGMKKDLDYKVGMVNFKGHGKAIAAGQNIGMIKILTSVPHGEILGAHIVGDQATELIGEFALAMSVEATTEDIINTIHAHPTMYEAIHEAALAAEGKIIHG